MWIFRRTLKVGSVLIATSRPVDSINETLRCVYSAQLQKVGANPPASARVSWQQNPRDLHDDETFTHLYGQDICKATKILKGEKDSLERPTKLARNSFQSLHTSKTIK